MITSILCSWVSTSHLTCRYWLEATLPLPKGWRPETSWTQQNTKKNEGGGQFQRKAGLQVDFASDNQPLIKRLQIWKVARFQGTICLFNEIPELETLHIIEHVCWQETHHTSVWYREAVGVLRFKTEWVHKDTLMSSGLPRVTTFWKRGRKAYVIDISVF